MEILSYLIKTQYGGIKMTKVTFTPRTKASQLSKLLSTFDIQGNGAFMFEFDFMIRNGLDTDRFIEQYAHLRYSNRKGLDLLKVLSHEREKLLDRTRFESYEEFEEAYYEEPYKALSRLFGEFVNELKARCFIDALPKQIYDIHIKMPYARLIRVAVYIDTNMTA